MVKNIALLTGGDSSEWQIALQGAANIEKILDRTLYKPYTIVLRDKHWTYTAPDGTKSELDRNDFTLTVAGEKITLEYALIIIHGTPGEDGRLQGYLDMMGIPYSSCGFVSSVLTFDKSACKRAVTGSGIHLAKEILLNKSSEVNPDQIITELGLPLFVKPNASGSSFGVTKVKTPEELLPAIQEAFKESDQVLMEEFIEGREISCGVMIAEGKEYVFPITELVSQKEFFDYEAKYTASKVEEISPARLSEEMTAKVQERTSFIYDILGCKGIIRVDYIIVGKEPYLLEVNTTPGMTETSFIPQQVKAAGMEMKQVLSEIIEDEML